MCESTRRAIPPVLAPVAAAALGASLALIATDASQQRDSPPAAKAGADGAADALAGESSAPDGRPLSITERIDREADALAQLRRLYNQQAAALVDLRDASAGAPAGAHAELKLLHDLVRLAGAHGLSLSDATLERLAELEVASLGVADPDWAGDALIDALRLRSDDAKRAWRQWFIHNMPKESLARREIETAMRVGGPIRLTGARLDSEPIDTRDWLGDVILVDFWGSWCAPCVVDAPRLAALARDLGPRGLRILGVVYDDPAQAQAFIAEHPTYAWPNIAPVPAAAAGAPPSRSINGFTSAVANEFGVTSFPTYWLIDRSGAFRGAFPVDHLRDAIEALLRQAGESD